MNNTHMESITYSIIATLLYKLVSLIVGFLLSYLGYRLFIMGIWGESGDLEGSFGDNKLVVKKAAPGIFFALFGAIVIGLTISKGINFDNKKSQLQSEICVPAPPPMPD